MNWKLAISVLFLIINQSFSQISDTKSELEFILDFPDLKIRYEIDGQEIQLAAYKSSLNDNLFEKKQDGFFKQLKWASFGHPNLIQTTNNYKTSLFHESSQGFYTFVKLLTNEEREILADEAKRSFGFKIENNQILNLPLSKFQCKLVIPEIDAENKVLIGKAYQLEQNPLRLDFSAPKYSKDNIFFEKILLNNESNGIILDCKLQAKSKTIKSSELVIDTARINELKLKEKLFGNADQIYVTRNQLLNLANELYPVLNIAGEFQMPDYEFSELFVQEIIEQLTTGLSFVPFNEALPTLSKHSSFLDNYFDKIKSGFNKIFDLKNDSILKSEALNELNSKSDFLDKIVSFVNKFLGDKIRSKKTLIEQLNDLNEKTKNEIEWKIEGNKIVPQSLNVAQLAKSSFSRDLKFDKIRKNDLDSDFEKDLRLYANTASNASNFFCKELEAKYVKELDEFKKELNDSNSENEQLKTDLNEYEMDINNLKTEINDLKGNFTEELTKHENELNSLYSEINDLKQQLKVEKEKCEDKNPDKDDDDDECEKGKGKGKHKHHGHKCHKHKEHDHKGPGHKAHKKKDEKI